MQSLTILGNITSIPKSFCKNYNALHTVKLPDTVSLIGKEAFCGCTKLSNFQADGVVEIGESAFYNCSMLSEYKLNENVTTLGAKAFSGCTLLKEIVIPQSVVSVGRECFKNSVEKITFAEGCVKIPDKVCYGANLLTEVVMPETITEVGEYAFYHAELLKEFELPQKVQVIGTFAYAGVAKEEYLIPNTVEEIGRFAFTSAKKVIFEEGFSVIPEYACYGAKELTEVEIPGTVEEIGASAFFGCASLKIDLLGLQIKKIGNSAFGKCDSLEEITIPRTLVAAGIGVLPSSIKRIVFEDGTTTILSEFCQGKGLLEEVIIPDSVTEIKYEAFSLCSSLREVAIPENTVIGKNSFSQCTGLNKLVIGNHCTIKEFAFSNCSKIEEVEFGAGIVFEKRAFYATEISGNYSENIHWDLEVDNRKLVISGDGEMPSYTQQEDIPWSKMHPVIEMVEFEEGVSSVGDRAFSNFSELKFVVWNDSVQSIGVSAFENCDSLYKVNIDKNIKEISANAFSGCDSLKEINFRGDAPGIAKGALPNNENVNINYPADASGWNERVKNRASESNWNACEQSFSHDIVLLLDFSNSMLEEKNGLMEAVSIFTENVCKYENNTRVSYVLFAGDVIETYGLDYYDSFFVERLLGLQNTEGGTNYRPPLEAANHILYDSNAEYRSIIMFSDGEPSDLSDALSYCNDSFRNNYTVFSVGLSASIAYGISEDALIQVAGDESRYFSANNINSLISVFDNLSNKVAQREETVVHITRNGRTFELKENMDLYFIKETNEKIGIRIIPGLKYNEGDIAYYSVEKGDAKVRQQNGQFMSFCPETYFLYSNGRCKVVLYDKDYKVLEEIPFDLFFKESFKVQFLVQNGNRNEKVAEQEVKTVNEIKFPDIDLGVGKEISNWYTNMSFTGAPLFKEDKVTLNLKYIENDMVLYGSVRDTSSNFISEYDGWGFTNSGIYFGGDDYDSETNAITGQYSYEIRDEDFEKLIRDLSNSEANIIKNCKDSAWCGSCFGMSSSAIFVFAEAIQLEYFTRNGMTEPGEVKGLPQNIAGNEDVSYLESMINYCHLNQLKGDILKIRREYSLENESANLKAIIEKMIINPNPVVLEITIKNTKNGKSGGHAVVAYDFKVVEPNKEYSFNVYDCSSSNKTVYPVKICREGDIYTKDCPEWEKEETSLLFRVVLTLEELKSEELLCEPVIKANGSEKDYEQLSFSCNTDHFRITNGIYTSEVNGDNITGDLKVQYIGLENEYGFEEEYLYTILNYDSSQEICFINENNESFFLDISFERAGDGDFVSIEAEGTGTVRYKAFENVETSFTNRVENEILITEHVNGTPWSGLTISGANGIKVERNQLSTKISTKNQEEIDLLAINRLNELLVENISVDASGIELSSSDGQSFDVVKNDTIIRSECFGNYVLFFGNGGSTPETMKNIPQGALIPEPKDSKRAGYIFEGWFKDEACTELWDFDNDKVTSDTYLYAGWSVDNGYYCEVTFEYPGEEAQSILLAKGSKLTPEDCPKFNQSEEIIWYRDGKYTRRWDYEKDVIEYSTKLYAKGKECKVSFVTNSEDMVADMTVLAGTQIDAPVLSVREGYTLCGWCTDEACLYDWDFDTDKIVKDTVLYAKWIENERDKQDSDTGISVEIPNAGSIHYTGQAVKPKVIVRDNGKVLVEGTDYKVTYKNNVNVCDATDSSISVKKKPYVQVQGIGAYKIKKKLTEYFSIYPAEIHEADVEIPKEIAVKSGNKKQNVKPVVSICGKKISAKNYTVQYYTDKDCQKPVASITNAGVYYIVLEAVKDKDGKYTGNLCGRTEPVSVNVIGADKLVGKAKVKLNSGLSVQDVRSEEEALQILFKEIVIGKDKYAFSNGDTDEFLSLFEFRGMDSGFGYISKDVLQNVLQTSGTKTLLLKAKSGNEKGYFGTKEITVKVRGTKLQKKMFTVTYDQTGEKKVTAAEFTGQANVPYVFSDLKEGTDYIVTYVKGKQQMEANEIVDAGSYSVVISGINNYEGSIKYSFKINKCNLVTAYQNGLLSIGVEDSTRYLPSGAKAVESLMFDADGDQNNKVVLKEGEDYEIKYMNNKSVTTDERRAYLQIKGKGNFTGTLRGDGKSDASVISNKAGVVNELNYHVTQGIISDSKITCNLDKYIYKNDKITGAKVNLYDEGIKISPKEYKVSVMQRDEKTVLIAFTATNKNYYGEKVICLPANQQSVKDKSISVILDEKVYYYTGEEICPEITITTKMGEDITDKVTIAYENNLSVGKGKVIITGDLQEGYCGARVVNFVILPKWMKWMF
ncbi:MAG: VWA domain-containing protein [Lachnospiraceae bacterium]|nr:VWA domain-containing protein [Lachnospiraceae bacterium]